MFEEVTSFQFTLICIGSVLAGVVVIALFSPITKPSEPRKRLTKPEWTPTTPPQPTVADLRMKLDQDLQAVEFLTQLEDWEREEVKKQLNLKFLKEAAKTMGC